MIKPNLAGALTMAALVSLALSCPAQTDAKSDSTGGPALKLAAQELFDTGLPASWTLPPGWTRVKMSDGYALRIVGAQAGLKSTARAGGVFSDVTVEGQFTFADADGKAQLFVRESAAGAYVAQLDAAGNVTLEKRGAGSAVLGAWHATAEPQATAGAARTVQISAIGGALRVTVDDIDVLTANDTTPLPPGANQIGAVFTTASGVLTFDNYFAWTPKEVVTVEVSTTPPMAATAERDEPAPTHDNFVDRKIASQGRYADIGNNSGATQEMDEPVPAAAAGVAKTVWYEFTPPATQPYLLTTFGSEFNTVLAVYTGSWSALTEVASNDNVSGSLQAQLTQPLDSTKTYYIQLGGLIGSGHFEFRIMNPADATVPSTPVISSSATGAPSTPVADKGFTNNAQPVVAWEPRPTVTPFGYLAEISTEANFSSILTSGLVEDPDRFWEIAPALAPAYPPVVQKYYWRVAAMNFLGQTSTSSPAYSFTFDNEPPIPPQLTWPGLNEAITTFRPTITWKPVADAVAYRARICTNFSASTIWDGNEAIVTSPSFPSITNVPSGDYWYAVEAKDAAGNWSGFGEKRHFTVNVSLTPNGANFIKEGPPYTTDVGLTWASIPGATYDLEVATDPSFSISTIYQGLTSTSFTLPNMGYGNYYWRVTVNGQQLPMSLARSFNVTPPLPVAPLNQATGTTVHPVADKVVTADQTPLFDWTVPANWMPLPQFQSLTYELQAATDSQFTNVIFSKTGIADTAYEWDDPALPATTGTPYYWRVRARTNLGLFGAYSKTFSFTLATTPTPDGPVIQTTGALAGALADKALTNNETPTLDWTEPANWATPPAGQSIASYELQIAEDSKFTLGVTDYNPASSDQQIGLPPSPGKTYYWRVRAVTDLGIRGAYSKTYSFTLDTAPLANPVVTSPAKPFGDQAAIRPVIKWTALKGAAGYRVRIATNFNLTTVVHDVTVTGTSFTSPTDLNLGDYFYTVRSLDPAGNLSTNPVTRNFQVTPSQTPAKGTVILPKDATTPVDIVFKWERMTGVTNYQLQIAMDGDTSFTGDVRSFSLTETTYTFKNIRATASSYIFYWRVYPVGTTPPAGFYNAFAVFPPGVGVPTIAAGGVLQDDITTNAAPDFVWNAPNPAWVYTYQAQVAIDSKFSNVIAQFHNTASNATTHTWNQAPLSPGTYYWRIRAAFMPGEIYSPYSPTYRFTVVAPSATMPVLTAPEANTVFTTPRPTFKWKAVALSKGYRVRIASDSAGANPVGSDVETTKTSFTPTTDLTQGEYWICVESKDAQGDWSGYGDIRRFVVNYSQSPADDGLVVAKAPDYKANVVLKWTKIAGAFATCRVRFSSNPNFTSYTDSPNLPAGTTSYTLPNRTVGTYYWQVMVTGQPTLPAALAHSFTVTPPVPAAPVIQTEGAANGAVTKGGVTKDQDPLFDWTVPANWATPPGGSSLTYEVQISTEQNFSTLVGSHDGITNSFYEWPSIPEASLYYWRVRAITNLGVTSPFSPAYAFTLDIEGPTQPVLKTPVDSTTLTAARPVFTWASGSKDTRSYRLEIDDEADFLTPVFTTTTTKTSLALPQTLAQGFYYWRVMALDAAGNEVPSDTRTLTIDFRTAPVEDAAITGSSAAGGPVTFQWVPATGAPGGTTYTIEIDSDLDGTADTTLTPVTTSTATSTALPPGYYQYRLVASNGLGTSEWREFVLLPK